MCHHFLSDEPGRAAAAAEEATKSEETHPVCLRAQILSRQITNQKKKKHCNIVFSLVGAQTE